MTTDHDFALGFGALALIQKARQGFGIPGPYGANPAQMIPAGAYEVTGTQVALRDTPGGNESGRFNNAYGDNGGKVVGAPDQVDFDGQTGSAQGLTWAHVTVKSGALQGKSGYVAVAYLGPVGYAASKGAVEQAPSGGGGGGGNLPVSNVDYKTTDESSSTDYTPYILGGGVILALGVLGIAALSKKKRRHAHA
jgi:hypothetical protein